MEASDANSTCLLPTMSSRQPPHAPLADLFPLRLTSFEQFMLADDRPGYPRTFTVVIEFAGVLQREAFESAMIEVIQRNPLLSALVRRLDFKWHWVPTAFPADQIVWGEADARVRNSSFNLRTTPGFRASGSTDGVNSQIELVFHHAVCDGQGARRIILDWLTFYAAIVAPDSKLPMIDQLDVERLRSRGTFIRAESQADTTALPGEPTTFWQRCKEIYGFLTQQPTPLRPVSRVVKPKGSAPSHVLTCRFDRQRVHEFRDRLRGSRITLNDVAIGLLLNAIARWNRQHGESGKDRLYRILVPVDLREAGDDIMPAANRLSMVFITRPTSLCLDWPQLLKTIRDEMDYIEEHSCKYNLINALPIVHAVPGLVPLGVRLPICLSTAVLTNLGDTWRKVRRRFPEENDRPLVGNLQFIRAGGAPPLRRGTGLGIGLTFSLGELVIHSQFDSQLFSKAHAEDFMGLFAENWRQWAAASPTFP